VICPAWRRRRPGSRPGCGQYGEQRPHQAGLRLTHCTDQRVSACHLSSHSGCRHSRSCLPCRPHSCPCPGCRALAAACSGRPSVHAQCRAEAQRSLVPVVVLALAYVISSPAPVSPECRCRPRRSAAAGNDVIFSTPSITTRRCCGRRTPDGWCAGWWRKHSLHCSAKSLKSTLEGQTYVVAGREIRAVIQGNVARDNAGDVARGGNVAAGTIHAAEVEFHVTGSGRYAEAGLMRFKVPPPRNTLVP